MGDSSTSSRVRLRNTGGEIVEVQGGHIVKSTAKKDRHSKVCTSKGPRDRRARLAPHTAIQFYDVQDRLGFDRPSKAVDWLINKAKSAIDELEQLPAWHPTNCSSLGQEQVQKELEQEPNHPYLVIGNISCPSSKRVMTMQGDEDGQQALHQSGNANNSNAQNSSFLPQSLDSDAIVDTIKSFFPMGASDEASSSAMQFQNFPTPTLLSRNTSISQDLRLSLQSFQDPILLHHHNQEPQQHQNLTHHTEQTHSQSHIQGQVLLSGIPLGFDGAAGWPEHHQQAAEFSLFQRLAASNATDGDTISGSSGAATGYLFHSPPTQQPMLQQLLGQNQFLSQRGPLQSSNNTPSIRAWMDPSAISISTADHNQHHHHQHPTLVPIYPSSMSGIGGFSGFPIPARIQGDEEEHDGYPSKPSYASSDSRH